MECSSRQAAERIVAYHAGTLDPHAAAALEWHLKACPVCRPLSAAQQAVWSALDIWQPLPISPDFDQKLFQRIDAEERLRWWQRLSLPRLSWRPSVSLAGASAALLVAFLLRTPASVPTSPAPAQAKFQIEQVERALDDMDMLEQIGVETARNPI
jgi:hypothetical protein